MTNDRSKHRAVKMIRCPNCGAEYENGLLHCPYCRSVDDYQDESEYLEDLDELKDKFEDLPEDMARHSKRTQAVEAVRDFRRILMIIGLIAAAILVPVAGFFILDRVVMGSDESVNQRNRESYVWLQENTPKLNEMYEQEDYEGLLAFYNDSGDSGIYKWEHFDLLQALSKIEQIRQYDIPIVEEAVKEFGEGSKEVLEEEAYLLSNELELRYLASNAQEQEDRERIKVLAEEYFKDMEERFSLTEDEISRLDQMVESNYGSITVSKCKEFLKNR